VGVRVGGDVLLEEPSGQVASEFAGAPFALVEGDELFLALGIEHQLEGGLGVGEPAAAKGLACILGAGLGIGHDGDSR
jgi:hypothetical protein